MNVEQMSAMADHASQWTHEALLEKEAKKKADGGHLKPGTTAMLGALIGGPVGAGLGAEVGRRGRATEGSPALRSYLGSVLGIPAGALTGAAGGALLATMAKNPKLIHKLRIAVAKKGVSKAGFFGKGKAHKKLLDARLAKAKASDGPFGVLKGGERASLGALAGGAAGSLGGYFEGARRGAESVKYKDK